MVIYPFIKNVNGRLMFCSGDLVLAGVKKLGKRALSHFCCRNNTNGNFTVSFPDLEEIGERAFDSGLAVSKCTNVSFPKLKIVRYQGFFRMFYQLSYFTQATLNFPELTTVDDNAFEEAFSYTSKITTINFPKVTNLTSKSFYNMMRYHSYSISIHFPSNMQSTISSLSQYPTFGGSSSYIKCYFDL